MAKAFDCSVTVDFPTAKLFFSQGYEFALIYLATAAKSRSRAQIEDLCNAGLKVISIFEGWGDQTHIDSDNGNLDGQTAYQKAVAVRQPTGSTIYFAVDYDAQPSDMDNIEAYLRAADNVTPGYHIGVYGSYAVCLEMYNRGVVKYFWQTYAWSNHENFPQRNIFQSENGMQAYGIEFDLNETYGNEGWWTTLVEPIPVTPTINFDKVAAQKVIDDLAALYRASDNQPVMNAAHFAADALRDVTGIKKN